MRVFKNAWFERFGRKQGIADDTLIDAVRRAERGQIDADLGSGVIKQRIARKGGGRSGGYRTILLYMRKRRAFVVFGFAKSERENIDKDEETYFKAMAKGLLNLTEEHLAELIATGKFLELEIDDDEV